MRNKWPACLVPHDISNVNRKNSYRNLADPFPTRRSRKSCTQNQHRHYGARIAARMIMANHRLKACENVAQQSCAIQFLWRHEESAYHLPRPIRWNRTDSPAVPSLGEDRARWLSQTSGDTFSDVVRSLGVNRTTHIQCCLATLPGSTALEPGRTLHGRPNHINVITGGVSMT